MSATPIRITDNSTEEVALALDLKEAFAHLLNEELALQIAEFCTRWRESHPQP